MSDKEISTVEKIRASYQDSKITKLEELRMLDRKVERPAEIFAYIFGSVGSLVLGGGMCLVMPEVISGFMALGISVGLVGIAMVGFNYFIYKAILKSRRRKYKDEIMALSDEILKK